MEKAVVAGYEVGQRPPEYVYEPYRQRVLGQVLAALTELNQSLGEDEFFGGAQPNLADVNAVVAFDFTGLLAKDARQMRDDLDLINLRELATRANAIEAFAKTQWRG